MISNPALRPSEYTAALIKMLQERRDFVAGASALEIGIGSGVVLAAIGALDAAALAGVDVEADAVAAATALLARAGFAERATLYRGDMWEPVVGRRFDLIVANLPHFPMQAEPFGARLPSWSAGGPDGRRFVDAFVGGLAGHLRPNGRALMTHNAFVDLAATMQRAGQTGLAAREVFRTLVYIPPEKVARMTPAIRQREDARTLFRYGPHTFGEMAVLEIVAPAGVGDA